MTHRYQVYSSSLCLLEVQDQAQPRCSDDLTKKMIPHSLKITQQLKVPKSQTTLTLTNMIKCMNPPT